MKFMICDKAGDVALTHRERNVPVSWQLPPPIQVRLLETFERLKTPLHHLKRTSDQTTARRCIIDPKSTIHPSTAHVSSAHSRHHKSTPSLLRAPRHPAKRQQLPQIQAIKRQALAIMLP